jgi:hypothetical protein
MKSFKEMTSIPGLASLRWYWDKNKRVHWPCFIESNPEAIAAAFAVKPNSKQVVVKFIAKNLPLSVRGQVAKVFKNTIHPFNDEDHPILQWSPSKMQEYINYLGKYNPCINEIKSKTCLNLVEIQEKDKQYYLLVEEFFLQLIPPLLEQRTREKSQQRDERLRREQHELEREKVEQQAAEKATTPKLVHDSPKQEESEQKPAAVASPENQCRVLRAGDVLKFYQPNMVAVSCNLYTAIIVKVGSRKDGIVLKMSDNQMLPKDAKICLMKRILRGKLQDNKGATFAQVSEFKLDQSNNDKILVTDTATQKMKKLLQDSEAEVQNIIAEIYQKGSPTKLDEPDVQSSDKKRSVDASDSSPASKKSKPPSWLPPLQACLKNVEAGKLLRRCNWQQLKADEECILTAISVRHRLDERVLECGILDGIGPLVDDMAEEFDVSEETVWGYLNGNPKNLLSISKLNDLTEKCKDYIVTPVADSRLMANDGMSSQTSG